MISKSQVQKAMDVLSEASKDIAGLYPLYIDPNSGKFTTSQISFGALADSFYEYELKQFLQTEQKEERYLQLCK